MINLKFSIFQAMKQHIHTSKIVGGNVFFLPIDPNRILCAKLFSHID